MNKLFVTWFLLVLVFAFSAPGAAQQKQQQPIVIVGSGDNADSATRDAVMNMFKNEIKMQMPDEYRENQKKLEKLLREYELIKGYVKIVSASKYSSQHKKIKLLAHFDREELQKDLEHEIAEGESVTDDERTALADAKIRALRNRLYEKLDPKVARTHADAISKMCLHSADRYVQVIKQGAFRNGKITAVISVDVDRFKKELEHATGGTSQLNQTILIMADQESLQIILPGKQQARVNKSLLGEMTETAVCINLQNRYKIKILQEECELLGIDPRKPSAELSRLLQSMSLLKVSVKQIELQPETVRAGEYLVFVGITIKFIDAQSGKTIAVEKDSRDLTMADVEVSKGERPGGYSTVGVGMERALSKAVQIVTRVLCRDLLRKLRDGK